MSDTMRQVLPDDLYRLQWIQDGHISPDGQHIVYELSWMEGEEERSALYLRNLQDGCERQLTQGLKKDSSPRWSPSGRQVAFLSTRTEKPQIFVIAVDGGEAKQVTTLKNGVGSGPVWSPDGAPGGRQLAFCAPPEVELVDLSQPYRFTRHVYRFDGMGNVQNAVQEIFVTSLEDGTTRQLTHDNAVCSGVQWSPDGKHLLYLSSQRPDTHRFFPTLRVVDLKGKVTPLTDNWGAVAAAAWTPNGNIAFIGNRFDLPIGTQDHLWLMGASGGEPECRTTGCTVKIGGGLQADMLVRLLVRSPRLLVSADGESAFAPVQDGGTVQIYRISLTGAISFAPILSGDRSCLPIAIGRDSLLFALSTHHDPEQLASADLEGGNEQVLTTLNQSVVAGWDTPKAERLLFASSDGEQVEGWIMLPETGSAPYPTVLYIHGGPHSGFGHIFHFDFRMLCSAGYAVLFINQRASTGYGDRFATQIKGDWGNLDYKDLMAGVDYAIEKGYVDGNRMGVCGLSGGGNLSCWIVGQTDRFKAAVPENPVTNWVSFYGVSDIGPWFAVEQLGGHPHEIPEVYARCSPITYAHRCKTPTLLIQGEADWRCPAEQSEQFYTVLKVNGCPVEMVRLPNSPHAGAIVGPKAIRKAQNDALLGWMKQWV
ncbi:MAG: S9 family peptidase [Caldilineaceae bacterium]